MNTEELDRRIKRCVKVVDTLVQDLKEEEPNVPHAIALGALLSCLATLTLLADDHRSPGFLIVIHDREDGDDPTS